LFKNVVLTDTHLAEMREWVFAVDVSAWLHKGLYYNDYIGFIRGRLDLIDKFRGRAILVWDGTPPEMKRETLDQRANVRNRVPRSADHWNQGMWVTHDMRHEVKCAFFDRPNVRFIQAPCEPMPNVRFW